MGPGVNDGLSMDALYGKKIKKADIRVISI
jgi:hypothetical protein